MSIRLVTVKAKLENFTCVLTQRYDDEYHYGQWKAVIMDKLGNIHHCIFSCSSKQGRVSEEDAFKELQYWLNNR